MQVRVPASSANLGPGFDSLGLALGIYLTCGFQRAQRLSIRVSGRDAAQISTGEDNLIWRTALAVAADVRDRLPPIALKIDNDIPLGKGLGSSAAALTAGVVIADYLLGLHWKPHRILDEAAKLEGHPDNVAACVLGSIVASATDIGGAVRAVRVELPPSYGVAVVVPDFVLPTAESRHVLPANYSKSDAVFNVQRSALLIAALATGSKTVCTNLIAMRWCPASRKWSSCVLQACSDARSAAPAPPFWCSTNGAPSKCAIWCGRFSRCPATNQKRCACLLLKTGMS